MIGDSSHGIFNLQIKNISLTDDAEFECQVGPNRTLNVSSIRASANLTVLCKYHFIEFLKILECKTRVAYVNLTHFQIIFTAT